MGDSPAGLDNLDARGKALPTGLQKRSAAALRRGDVGSVELLEAHQALIDRQDRALTNTDTQ